MKRIAIYDTTLRDGSQGEGVNFSLEDKLLLTKKLDELGVDYIEGGYPLSNPKDHEYFVAVQQLPLKHSKVCAFGMTRRKNSPPETDTCLKALIDSQAPVICIVGKTWDMQVQQILSTSLEENLKMIEDSIAYCRSLGREVMYDAEHFFDGYKANPEYALKTLKAAEKAGASVVILCDTNGGTMPEVISERVTAVCKEIKCQVGIHCHNDCELAVANSLAAVRAGASQVQGTMNGIGERCGNVDLVSVIANLNLKYGLEVLQPGSLAKLTEASRYVYEIANLNHRNGQPFVGQSAFAHKGGMHTHAVALNPVSYEHIDPTQVGNERRVLVSELSGRSTILTKTQKYDLHNDKPLMSKILNQVQDLENDGYEFEAAEASFDLLVKKVAGLYKPWFDLIAYRVNIEHDKNNKPITEATVKIGLADKILHTVAEGDGPVNALDGALRKALLSSFPQLSELQLVDYKVRVVNNRAGTAAKVRVTIESRDQGDVWGTIGVSENIIEASWLALVDSIEYKLFKDKEAGAKTN
ncbi:citramalate synthase [Telmatocola sphagniphila]|uniref:Citramalate synthase n=1 Tax=Telmatocola sphagniphila TaxID=1123043 RepID=A0A8E6EWZ3_9BACT|nr:citramalate synthase [Telmatocola sphagniphila]QVL34327.1 citramalate synthase [Telmatocola sphagniphila]